MRTSKSASHASLSRHNVEEDGCIGHLVLLQSLRLQQCVMIVIRQKGYVYMSFYSIMPFWYYILCISVFSMYTKASTYRKLSWAHGMRWCIVSFWIGEHGLSWVLMLLNMVVKCFHFPSRYLTFTAIFYIFSYSITYFRIFMYLKVKIKKLTTSRGSSWIDPLYSIFKQGYRGV